MEAVHQNYAYGNKFESCCTLNSNINHDRIKQQACGNICDIYIQFSCKQSKIREIKYLCLQQKYED